MYKKHAQKWFVNYDFKKSNIRFECCQLNRSRKAFTQKLL